MISAKAVSGGWSALYRQLVPLYFLFSTAWTASPAPTSTAPIPRESRVLYSNLNIEDRLNTQTDKPADYTGLSVFFFCVPADCR